MKLGTRIMLLGTAAVVLATVLSIAIVYQVSRKNRVAELRGKMSSIIEQSELVAQNMDAMHEAGVFDIPGVQAASIAQAGGRPLREAYASTDLYKTIPIVAAWKSVEGAAKKNDFQFQTPSRPGVPARNSKNNNGQEHAAAFEAFALGEAEYFVRNGDELVLARPVSLQASCLTCHGDPAHSASGDGKDLLGFPMENMKLDDLKGAFVLKAGIGRDPVVMPTMKVMGIGGLVVLAMVLSGFYFFDQQSIVRPLAVAIHHIEEAGSQAQGIAQINIAVGEMDKVTQTTPPMPSKAPRQPRNCSLAPNPPTARRTNGNGRLHQSPALASAEKHRQGDIPFEGDFKDF